MKMAKPGNTASHQAKGGGAGFLQDRAPGDQLGGHADAEKAQTRLDENRAGDAEHHGNDDRRQGVGQNMLEHDFPIGNAEGNRRGDVVVISDSEKFIAGKPRDAYPTRSCR